MESIRPISLSQQNLERYVAEKKQSLNHIRQYEEIDYFNQSASRQRSKRTK